MTLFKRFGAAHVLDASFANAVALLEVRDELLERRRLRHVDGAPPLPLLCSECPGWICYAEKHKQATSILPHVSRVKSPQAIMGIVANELLLLSSSSSSTTTNANSIISSSSSSSSSSSTTTRRIYHCCVMPCFDKKVIIFL